MQPQLKKKRQAIVPQGTREYTVRTFLFVFTCPVSSHRPPFLDTYSADFQKCPGWDSLRLSLGSFSSMSASWVKVGLSLRSYAQQAERISWDDRQLWVRALRTINDDRSWYSCITRAWMIICHSYASSINMIDTLVRFSFNSQWPPCRGWSPPRPSLCPLRSPPARWWLPQAGWWLASP